VTVTVTPASFSMVEFDPGQIARTTEELLDRLGMQDRDVVVDVDETSPIARVLLESTEPLTLKADSGAFEDTRRPRQQSEEAIVTSLGRVLLRVRDREHAGFAGAPADPELTLAQIAAWDAYAVGRLGRLGYPAHRQRWLYAFRNRHGFSDQADTAFEDIWSSDELSWDELDAISSEALAARAPLSSR
jgi:hypothetical protein